MNWLYRQSSGCLSRPSDGILDVGYAGAGDGKNNPEKQDVPNVGPLPRGWYTIAERVECITELSATCQACPDCHATGEHKHGAFVLRLIPDAENEMHGRGGFLFHGDNGHGTASKGCPCFALATRRAIAADPCKRLRVDF